MFLFTHLSQTKETSSLNVPASYNRNKQPVYLVSKSWVTKRFENVYIFLARACIVWGMKFYGSKFMDEHTFRFSNKVHLVLQIQ
jgi:hypothetical protein